MKKKIFSLLFALVLSLSFSLAPASPVKADGSFVFPGGSITTGVGQWCGGSGIIYPATFDLTADDLVLYAMNVDMKDSRTLNWSCPYTPPLPAPTFKTGFQLGITNQTALGPCINPRSSAWMNQCWAGWNQALYYLGQQWYADVTNQFQGPSFGWNTPYQNAGPQLANGGYHCTGDAGYDTFDVKMIFHDLGPGNGFRVTVFQRVHKTTNPLNNAAMTWFQMFDAPQYQDVPEAAVNKSAVNPFVFVGNWEYAAGGGTVTWGGVAAVQGTPNEVWVDDDWVGSYEGQILSGHVFGYDAFGTIQEGINAVASGGTVNVAAGTYNVTQVVINKSLMLTGAGAATTIIDGGKATTLPSAGMVRIQNVSTGPVVIQGFTLQNAGGNAGTIAAVVMRGSASPVTIQNNHFIGYNNLPAGSFDMGIWEYSNDGALTIQNNEFEKMWQAILLERPRGGASVLSNNFHNLTPAFDSILYEGEGIFAFTYSGENVSNLIAINNNTFSGYSGDSIIVSGGYSGSGVGQFSNVQIMNNTSSAIGSGTERRHVGILLSNAPGGTGTTGGVLNAVVSGNTLTGTTTTNDSIGIWLRGPNNNATIQGNTITSTNRGIAVTDYEGNGLFSSGVNIHYNNITGNGTGVDNSANTNIVNAVNNWWGCNDGPGIIGPGSGDKVSDNVTYDPWLVLNLSANPPINPADGVSTSVIIADMTKNSDGQDTSAEGHIPDGTQIIFTTDTGSIESPRTTTSGIATAVFTSSTNSSLATISAKAPTCYTCATASVSVNMYSLMPPPISGGGGGGGVGIGVGEVGFGQTTAVAGATCPLALAVNMLGQTTTARMTSYGVLCEDCLAFDPTRQNSWEAKAGTKLTLEGNKVPQLIKVTLSGSSPSSSPAETIGPTYDINAYASLDGLIPSPISISPLFTMASAYDLNELPENTSQVVFSYYPNSSEGWLAMGSEGVVAEVGQARGTLNYFVPNTLLAKIVETAAKFEVSNLTINPSQTQPTKQVTVSVNVANTGSTAGNYSVELKVNGITKSTKEISVAAGTTSIVNFTVAEYAIGRYQVEIAGLKGEFVVAGPPSINWWPIGGIIAAIILALAIWMLIRLRRFSG
jgi:hypothetical protein